MKRRSPLELEDAYHDWQEALYFNSRQDEIDRLEEKYYEIFQEVSNEETTYSSFRLITNFRDNNGKVST